jgi:hypothetical protein
MKDFPPPLKYKPFVYIWAVRPDATAMGKMLTAMCDEELGGRTFKSAAAAQSAGVAACKRIVRRLQASDQEWKEIEPAVRVQAGVVW